MALRGEEIPKDSTQHSTEVLSAERDVMLFDRTSQQTAIPMSPIDENQLKHLVMTQLAYDMLSHPVCD